METITPNIFGRVLSDLNLARISGDWLTKVKQRAVKLHRVVIMLAVFTPAAGIAGAGREWLSLTPQALESETGVVEVVHNDDELVITVRTPGFFSDRLEVGETTYTVLDFPQGGSKGQPGHPQLPFRSIRVPLEHGLRVGEPSFRGRSTVVKENVTVIPAHAPEPGIDNRPSEPKQDPVSYAVDGWLPERLFNVTADIVVRGQRYLILEVSPLQFNPVMSAIAAYPEIEIRIPIRGAVDEVAEAMKHRRRKSSFPTSVSSRAELGKTNLENPTGIEYLIIAADEFVASVAPLEEWKRLKGLTVETVAMSSVGSSSDDIQLYLENRYATDPDLTYVLLVGDHEQVPSASLIRYVSDHSYSCLDGDDYFPDIVLGRISVQTTTECDGVVSKLLSYERFPDPGGWHNNALTADVLEDGDGNCYTDWWFFETGIHVMHFLMDTVGMDVATAFSSWQWPCSVYRWHSASYPHRFDGYRAQPIPDSDLALLTTDFQATQGIISAIDAGVGIVQFDSTGDENEWGEPSFRNSDIATLDNGPRYPVVFSITALTGAFDYDRGDCFAEAFLKKTPGGAVGVVASSWFSWVGYSNLLTHGTYDSFWDFYDPDDGGNPYPHSFRPAEALAYAKAYMHHWMGEGYHTKFMFEVFHWFGDPEMELITEAPVTPTVSVSCPLPVGSPTLTVASDIDGAIVAVTRDGELLGRSEVAGGVAIVTLAPAPEEPGSLDVVVSGRNLIPVETTCQVTAPEGSWLVHTSHTVNDIAGNGDGIVNAGESMVLPITVKNIGTTPGTGISGILRSSSAECTITDSTETFPDLGVGVSGESDPDHFALQVDFGTTNGTSLPLYVDWIADGGYSGSTALSLRVCTELVISDVQITEISDFSARVSWTTNVPATSAVNFGAGQSLTSKVESANLVTNHSVELVGLGQCKRYAVEIVSESPGCYQVTDNNGGANFRFVTPGRRILFADDVEAGNIGWTVQSGLPWEISDEAAHTPTHAWTDSPEGDYADYTNMYLMSPVFDLSEASDVRLRFFTIYDLELGWDFGTVEISWQEYDWRPLAEFTGYPTDWSREIIDLSDYAGHHYFRFLFRLETDDRGTRDGWFIDDIELSEMRNCSKGRIVVDQELYNCDDTIEISVTDLDLDLDSGTQETISVLVTSESEPSGEAVDLIESDTTSELFIGSIFTTGLAPDNDGLLSLANGDEITATYEDSDDGSGVPVTLISIALADCSPPSISDVQVLDSGEDWAKIGWLTDEAADSEVLWDVARPPVASSFSEPEFVLSHSPTIGPLSPCTTYYFFPSSTNVVGYTSSDINGGQYYSLATRRQLSIDEDAAGTPVAIPDADPAGLHSTIEVAEIAEVRDVDVLLNITHPWDSDLDMFLVGPNGTRVELSNDNGGSDANYVDTVFNDQAAVSIIDGSAPFTGSYRPEQPLSLFDGILANGQWTLVVEDDLDDAVGVLESWQLRLTLFEDCTPLIFSDNFEVGTTSAWSATGP